MLITYYGHSCFHIQIQGKNILFDPFITGNQQASHINISKIEADYILISHAHNDHVGDSLAIAKRTGATIIGIWEVGVWFEKQGISNVVKMNIGGSWQFDFGKVKLVNAVHTSRFTDGTHGGQPCGFYITTEEGNFYFAGDTALHYDMKLLGKHANVRFAFLPIGDVYTMDVDDALIASKYIKCDKIIGMHYDSFDLIKIDHAKAKDKFANQDKKLYLMTIGEKMEMRNEK
ncbi:MAG: metal-dependent hydrolase [Fimbriimonadaceae bacterium]|nr:metal-dependent hydrolase [Chitinophagales bacterium]